MHYMFMYEITKHLMKYTRLNKNSLTNCRANTWNYYECIPYYNLPSDWSPLITIRVWIVEIITKSLFQRFNQWKQSAACVYPVHSRWFYLWYVWFTRTMGNEILASRPCNIKLRQVNHRCFQAVRIKNIEILKM